MLAFGRAPRQLEFSILMLAAASLSTVATAVCYNNTQAMLTAQVNGETQLEICSNTVLELGVPLSADLTEWSNMIPLVIIKDDVEVYCGPDKKSTNNCVLRGGILQLVTSVVNPLLPQASTTDSTHNLKVMGLTFTGTASDMPGLIEGASVAIGAPGTNMVFDDCIWESFTASHTFFVARNALTSEEQFPAHSANVTISNSVFKYVPYSQESIQNEGQIVNLQSVEFSNVDYAPICHCDDPACTCTPQSYLMELTAGSTTTLQDVQIDSVTVFTSLILQANEGTELVYSNQDLSIGWFFFYNPLCRNATDHCEGGLVVDTVANGSLDECVQLNMTFSGGGGSDDVDSVSPTEEAGAPNEGRHCLVLVLSIIASLTWMCFLS